MARLRTVQEFLALDGDEAPTPAELQLVAACQAGEVCVLGDGTRPEVDSPERRVRAELLRLLILGGTEGCGLDEVGVALIGGWVTGTLDLRLMQGRGQLVLQACNFENAPQIDQGHFALLSLHESKSPGLFAQGLKVDGSVYLRGMVSVGTVDLNAAMIGGQLACDGASFNGAGGKSLHAHSLKIAHSLILSGITAKGTVDLSEAEIGGQINAKGASFDGGGSMALFAQGVKVAQTLFLNAASTLGKVSLNAAEIKGQFAGDHAVLNGGGGWALHAQGLKLGQGLFLRFATAQGTVEVAGAEIAGQMNFTGATLDGGKGKALIAQRLKVARDLVFKNLRVVSGDVILTSAHVGDLTDDMESWGKISGKLYLDGFTYDRISGATLEIGARLGWLTKDARHQGVFSPQPYTQLAKVLREMGHNTSARRVLFEREYHLGNEALRARYKRPDGKFLFPLENPWRDVTIIGPWLMHRASRWVVGYGFLPWRALGWLGGLWFIACLLVHLAWESGGFAPNSDVILVSDGWKQAVVAAEADPSGGNPAKAWSDEGAPGQDWETFNRYAWAVDLVVPVLDVGQTAAWQPSAVRGYWGWYLWWARWGLEIAGWIVSALGVAAITGIMQRDRG